MVSILSIISSISSSLAPISESPALLAVTASAAFCCFGWSGVLDLESGVLALEGRDSGEGLVSSGETMLATCCKRNHYHGHLRHY